MRISEFAKKHKTTQDTIRHYLELGLLIFKKEGFHYRFNESDSMENGIKGPTKKEYMEVAWPKFIS